MRRQAVICTIAALSMSFGGFAAAQQDKDIRSDRAGQGSYDATSPRERGWDRDHRDHRENRDYRDRRDYRERRGYHGPPPGYGYDGYRGRGAGPDHSFYRGSRLPPQWRSRHYVVDDWRAHHLRPPPRGYYWVQTGADYVLVAIATGIIASIILNQ
jgi:Ni/Co efflux regulator RcnB